MSASLSDQEQRTTLDVPAMREGTFRWNPRNLAPPEIVRQQNPESAAFEGERM
jgi:hypothetical protein